MRQLQAPILVVSVPFGLLATSTAAQLVVGAVAFQQPGSPLQIPSVTVSTEYVYEDVTLQNASDKAITEVTLGVLGYDEGNPGQRILLRDKAADLALAPGARPRDIRPTCFR
jgi:hypothetical protein